MISRLSLAGLTLVSFAAPALALAPADGAAPMRRAVARHVVQILPPARPLPDGEALAAEAVATVDPPASAPSGPAPVRTAAIDVLPPLRPSLPAETTAEVGPPGPEPLEEMTSVVRVVPPARPAFPWDADAPAAPVIEAVATPPAPSLFGRLFQEPATVPFSAPSGGGRAHLDQLIAHHARLNGVPESLVHRVVVRESRYNPRAVGRGGAMGLMQIKTGTARALGYGGGPSGLLDAETNLTYAVKYLAGAYRVAGGDHDRTVGHYARGYYYEARRQGLTRVAERGRREVRGARDLEIVPGAPSPAPAAAPAQATFRSDENR